MGGIVTGDPIAGLDGARRAGWARAYAAEARVAELSADLPPPVWTVTARHEHDGDDIAHPAAIVRPARGDGPPRVEVLIRRTYQCRDAEIQALRLPPRDAMRLARSIIAAVQYAESNPNTGA